MYVLRGTYIAACTVFTHTYVHTYFKVLFNDNVFYNLTPLFVFCLACVPQNTINVRMRHMCLVIPLPLAASPLLLPPPQVRVRRIQIMPLFEDYDKVHIGSVTRSQFHRVLSELELGGKSIPA